MHLCVGCHRNLNKLGMSRLAHPSHAPTRNHCKLAKMCSAHRPWGLQGLYTTVPSCCLTKPSLFVNTFPMVFGPSQHQSRQEAVPAWSLTVSVNDYFHASGHEVVIESADDPQQLPLVRRWLAVLCLSTAALGITCASSMVRLA